jgi:hypothetical protein
VRAFCSPLETPLGEHAKSQPASASASAAMTRYKGGQENPSCSQGLTRFGCKRDEDVNAQSVGECIDCRNTHYGQLREEEHTCSADETSDFW